MRCDQTQEQAAVPSDHQLFIGRDDPYRDPAFGHRDPESVPGICLRVEFNAQPCGRLADSPADFGRVLPDAGGENQSVDAAQYGGQRADFLGGPVHEVIYCQPRFRLAACKKLPHVAADTGNRAQTRLLVEDRLHLRRGESQVLKQVQNYAGVDPAWPRAHTEAVERRESEAAVNTLSVPQGAEAGAVSQMGDDDTCSSYVRCHAG